jgi:signal transduction histidine kinase
MTFARRAGPEVAAFRRKLIVALMLVVSALTGLGLYLAQRASAASAARELQQSFQAEISALHKVHELRHAALAQRCAAMAQKPRIHAALEDNALDLLYPSAKEELRGLLEGNDDAGSEKLDIEARFCRFLDSSGAVLPPPHPEEFGKLAPETEASLNLKSLPDSEQIGYLPDVDAGERSVNEVTAVPIFSTETGKVISALVVGFAAPSAHPEHTAGGIISGIWVGEQLYLPGLSKNDLDLLGRRIGNAIKTGLTTSSLIVHIGSASHFLFYKQLNPGSVFPPAYEVCVYPLTASAIRLRRLRWQIAGAGAGLLLAGFVGSHWIAMRLAKPVEQLAADSAKEKAEREEAEAALALTTEELERSSRYSADASHQLKSPVTLLRTGLESLLSCEDLRPEIYEELAVLLHQTRRLTSVIDDLLLLSRVDAGRMEIKAGAVNLSQLIDEWLDDLEALPDSPDVTIERDIPAQLFVAGEKQYVSLIVQNLLENARKYNRAGGRISVTARAGDQVIFLRVGNTGRTIPSAAQSHVFERFYRAGPNGVGGGHGIGLNLARELARLQGGELRLLRSDGDWTEFEVRLRMADVGRIV